MKTIAKTKNRTEQIFHLNYNDIIILNFRLMSVVLLLAADAFSFLSSSSSFQYNKIFSAPAVNSQFYSSHDHITTATHIPIIGSFTSAVNSKTKKKNPTKLRVALRSSSTTENEKDNTEISTASIKEKQDFVKEALLKLIERQQRELEDTKTLLHKLEREGNDLITMNNDTKATVTTTNSTSIRSSSSLFSDGISTIAASIFSGADYGFQSRSEGCRFGNILTKSNPLFDGYGPPANIISLATQQFQRNLDAIRGDYKDEKEIGLSKNQKLLQAKLKQLTLNSTAIWERERSRGPINAPIVVKVPYFILCYFLDVLFEGRYIPSRFFLLETVARMPYFSYISMLHLYETLGWWRRSADVKRVHFAEEWNEYHHLLIMESLGGDQQWSVRFLAQHSAIAYYWGLIALFATSPSLSYKFSELLETHAVDTYGQFLDENEVLLKELPPSFPAVDYYSIGITDPLFGEYQTSSLKNDESVSHFWFFITPFSFFISLHQR